jgi:allantoate deiminase
VPDVRAVLERCDVLARCSEEPGRLTRRFATPALAEARDLVAGWMREAGLEPRCDAVGNLIGRRDGPGPTLLLGSHLDSVRDAGRYDGPLGVLLALAAAARVRERPLPFALEVVAFADEEGVRYGTAFLGSAVLAGRFEAGWLERRDADGVAMADAIRGWGGDPAAVAGPGRDDLLAYCEVHIEQGPVLDDAGLPIGVVEAIAGQTRASVTFAGAAAHAGTTPMAARRDALAAAAEWIGAVEAAGRGTAGLVATVGELDVDPGASNVVPGRVVASLDVRHADDATRVAAVRALRGQAAAIGVARGVEVGWEDVQATRAVRCDPGLTDHLAGLAAAVTGARVPRLASGAGHDAVMLSAVAPVAMLFVRCERGVSHHPDEAVRSEDVAVALDVITRLLEELAA